MKKRLTILGIAVLCIVLLRVLIGVSGLHIDPLAVEKVELKTYDHRTRGEIELTALETWKLLALYNSSTFAGLVNAEPCCDAYGFKVYFRDGNTLYIGQGVRSKMIVRPDLGDAYYVQNQLLIQYIYALAEKYDLPID